MSTDGCELKISSLYIDIITSFLLNEQLLRLKKQLRITIKELCNCFQ